MLNENLKNLRKLKGLSQEELAIKLNVVRQTVSKWEKGLSVPDSEMIIKIADALDTSVNVLLDEKDISKTKTDENAELKIIAEKLELLNEQFARRNENRRKIWRIIFIVTGVISVSTILIILISLIYFFFATNSINSSVSIIGGADGPTSVCVTEISFQVASIITVIIPPIIAAIVSFIGIYKTKRI